MAEQIHYSYEDLTPGNSFFDFSRDSITDFDEFLPLSPEQIAGMDELTIRPPISYPLNNAGKP